MSDSHEVIIPNEGFPFKMFLFEGKDGSYKRARHWHRSIELFLVQEGTIDFYIGGQLRRLGQEEFILVNSNEVHSIDALHRNRTIVLQIPLKVFEDYLIDGSFILFTHGEPEQDEKMAHLLKKMYENYEAQGPGYELKVKSQFYMLLYLLVTKYRVGEVDVELLRRNKNLNKLSTITSYLKENYKKPLTLEELAQTFGYSPAYLSRMFKKYANTNYKHLLQDIRLEHGFQELLHTDKAIGQISMDAGFPNIKAFSQAFARHYGIQPAEYRKKIKKVKKLP